MSTRDGFDGFLSDWLDDTAGRGAPDYVDEILVLTTRTRQRPAWSSLERWLPLQTTLRFAPVPRLGWVLLISLAIAAAVGIAILAVGSRSPHVPPPFGPARNGEILYGGTDNDIHALDPVTGVTTTLVTGASGDHRPVLSPDGLKLLFLRDTDTASQPMIMVANADGSDVRPLTGAIAHFGSAAWSHDGSTVLVADDNAEGPSLKVFTVDETRPPLTIDTEGMTALLRRIPAWAIGRSRSAGPGPTATACTRSASDGHGLRTILPPGQGDGASLSPDGTKIAYQVWDGSRRHRPRRRRRDWRRHRPGPRSTVGRGVDRRQADLVARRHSAAIRSLRKGMEQPSSRRARCGWPACPDRPRHAQLRLPGVGRVLAGRHAESSRTTALTDRLGSSIPTGASAGTKLSSTIADAASWQRTAP